MRRAKKITAFAVAAAMVFSNVAYAAPGTTTSSVTSESGAESEESLNSQSGASEGTGDQASDQGTSGTESSAGETEETSTKNTTTDASGQSETQETKNEDQGSQTTPAQSAETQKSEDEQKDSVTKEEAKVLYDINFVTPEKHGKVTDMNGSEVADGKTLKTDENGKVQFKVKADDGYQVSAVYQMPNEQTPLKLVKDSYYELQVDKNTTVKVVYQKIPEEKKDGEDADSDAEEPKEDAGETVEDQQSAGEQTADDNTDSQILNENSEDKKTGDEEVSKPKQTLKVSASDGAVITIEAPKGALPDGAQVEVTVANTESLAKIVAAAVADDGKQLKSYKAYDIVITNANGNEIQPDKSVKVEITNTGVAGEDKAVYHVEDESSAVEKIADVKNTDNAVFSADHFSVYVVTGIDSNVSTRTITSDKRSIGVGESIYLTTNENDGNSHSWRSSNQNIVSVSNSSAKGATVTGKKAGKATITHSWKEWDWSSLGNVSYSEEIEITVTAQATIKFNLNGGQGTTPESITGETGTLITLPNGNGITRNNYELLGWSTSQNPNAVNTGYDAVVYKLGAEYEI